MNINDLTITSLETISAFAIGTGAYMFTLDELQNAKIDQTEDKQDITGKRGRKLSSLKKNKSVKISGTNGMVSSGLLAIQTGGDFKNGVTEVLWTDYLTVADNKATTSFKAVGTLGAEIMEVIVKNAYDTLGTKLTQGAEASDGVFAYNPTTKELTFSNIADNTEVVVVYNRKITADSLDNMSETYAGKCTLYVDALAEDKCANVYRIQFFIPKADFSGTFSIEMGDNQTVHAFEAEALAGACGAAGKLWTATIFGNDAKDV